MSRLPYMTACWLSLLLLAACTDEVPAPIPAPVPHFRYLALGDSYTIGQSVAATERFPSQLVDSLGTRGWRCDSPTVIAKTGWTTANLATGIAQTRPDSAYDLVTLLIGVNNQYQGRSLQEYNEEFSALLEHAIALAGGDRNRVLVISIPDYGYTPYGWNNKEKIGKEIDAFNGLNQYLTLSQNVVYVDITGISRKADGSNGMVAADGLHPSGKQYALWVQEMIEEAEACIRR